jgi:protein-S-isoprenylcysteine O-methyltransferase Ste14
MMGDYQYILRKSIAVLLILFFMNSIFLIFTPEVYIDPQTLVPIALLTAITCIDVTIRSISPQRDRYSRVVVGVAFLLFPFMVALPYYEWHLVISKYQHHLLFFVAPVGILILLFGSVILLVSRIQIGQYGGAKITLEEDHRLITNGMYRHIRNPQYLGFLLIFIGYSFSLGGLIIAVVTALGLFIVFRSRILLEEKLLLEAFGEEYAEYMRRTWKLLPRIY